MKCGSVIQGHYKVFFSRVSGYTLSIKVTCQVSFPWGVSMFGGANYFLCFIFLFPFSPHNLLCFS